MRLASLTPLLATLAMAALLSAPANAFVSQTIVVDGVNDFDASNLLDDDRLDTEIKNWCTADPEDDAPMDLGRIYITNDANFLYLGWEYFEDCFGDVQLGIAIDVNNTPAGGTTDPFGRKLSWSGLTNKPDAYIYIEDTPGNYEIFYKWNGSAWVDQTTLINPSGSGSNALGATNTSSFIEIKIPLAALGVTGGQPVNVELWMTQNGPNKGPLDAACSDAVQMSTPSGTTFDTTPNIVMTCMHPFTTFSVTDAIPPTVESATAVGFTLLGNLTFSTASNKIDVLFSEPVDLATSENDLNYTVSGAGAPLVLTAERDLSNPALVHLVLASTISAATGFYNVTVTGVKDQANNTIVANGNTNVGSFVIRNLAFEGDFSLRLCNGEFAPGDAFAIEGSLAPLTFTVGDNARLYDPNMDEIYATTVPFSVSKNRTTGKAEAALEWKFSHTPAGDPYEPGSNRMLAVSSDSASSILVAAAWANDVPENFTDKEVDVIFQVKTGAPYLTGTHTLWLQGSAAPLTFTIPGLEMKDDGMFPDAMMGDDIYTAIVRFPVCAPRNVNWKAAYDTTASLNVLECWDQGDRSVYVNSDAFGIVGSMNGPLTLPARGMNRCQVTDKDIAVRFRVFLGAAIPGPSDVVAVAGSPAPLSFGPPPAVAGNLADNGIAPDATAGDRIYTGTVVFPDKSPFHVDFKYWYDQWTNSGFECEGFGNRGFDLDDFTYSVASPYLRNLDLFNHCADLADVPFGRGIADAGASFAVLRQSVPNPSSGGLIHFDLERSGRVSLRIFDITGRQVAELMNRELTPGPHDVRWDGRNAEGQSVRSGVYLYELSMNGERLARRMVVAR